MELKKFEVNGREVEFVNTFRGTRNGFAHDTVLFIGGIQKAEATCHYLNRTWESYTYQTVMKKAVGELLDKREAYLVVKFKEERGYKKLTENRVAEFKKFRNADEFYTLYTEIYRRL